MSIHTPGFTPQFDPRSEYVAGRRDEALNAYKQHRRLPYRLAAPTLIDPLFRLKVDERIPHLPAGTKRGASVVDMMNQRDASKWVVLVKVAEPSLELTRFDGTSPVEGTREVLIELLDTDDLILVAVDYTALYRMIDILDNGPDDRGKVLAMFVRWASSNRFGSHVALLTDALAQRYYTPPTMKPGQIEKWAKAFHVDPDTWDGLWTLLHACTEDAEVNKTQSDAFGSIAQDMAFGRNHLRTRLSNDSANQLFSASQNTADAEASIMNADPIGVHEMLRTGEVSQISPLTRDWPLTVAVSSPTRLKPGTKYRVFTKSMDKIGEVIVSGLTVDPDTQAVNATLSVPTPGAVGQSLARAVATKETFYLLPVVFLNQPGKKTSRWAIGQKLDPVGGRNVPLGVLLAGTPS